MAETALYPDLEDIPHSGVATQLELQLGHRKPIRSFYQARCFRMIVEPGHPTSMSPLLPFVCGKMSSFQKQCHLEYQDTKDSTPWVYGWWWKHCRQDGKTATDGVYSTQTKMLSLPWWKSYSGIDMPPCGGLVLSGAITYQEFVVGLCDWLIGRSAATVGGFALISGSSCCGAHA